MAFMAVRLGKLLCEDGSPNPSEKFQDFPEYSFSSRENEYSGKRLEVLGEGFGEALLTRRSSPIFLF